VVVVQVFGVSPAPPCTTTKIMVVRTTAPPQKQVVHSVVVR